MSTPRKVKRYDPNVKLTYLKLAKDLGNVSQVCRSAGLSRSEFYEMKRRFELEGFEGLINKPPIPKSHPDKKSEDVIDKVLEMTKQFPSWGKDRIGAQLRLEGVEISGATVRNIWKDRGIHKQYERGLWVLGQIDYAIELNEEQIEALKNIDPCLKERHIESKEPGYLLSQDTFFVGHFKGIGRVYMQAVIDTFCSFGFAKLYTSKTAITAADMLYEKVIPFYKEQRVEIQHVLTDNGSEYCGKQLEHPYQLILILHGIKHRRTKVATPRTNGFVERFNRTVLNEFYKGILRRKFYTKLEDLQSDLDQWMTFYNYKRAHLGYRNKGNTPWKSWTKKQNKKVA